MLSLFLQMWSITDILRSYDIRGCHTDFDIFYIKFFIKILIDSRLIHWWAKKTEINVNFNA